MDASGMWHWEPSSPESAHGLSLWHGLATSLASYSGIEPSHHCWEPPETFSMSFWLKLAQSSSECLQPRAPIATRTIPFLLLDHLRVWL